MIVSNIFLHISLYFIYFTIQRIHKRILPHEVETSSNVSSESSGGFDKSWNSRNCDKLRTKTDRKICLRVRRRQCYAKLEARLKREKRKWPKTKIVFSCKKRQKRDRCVNYLLKDNSRQLKKILKGRNNKKHYSNKKHKSIAKKMCKKKVSNMKYKYYKQRIKLSFKRKSAKF